MKLSTLRDEVKSNLGNRASGKIGLDDVDTASLKALNQALLHCVLEADPDYWNRICEIDIVTGTRIYDLPVVDSLGETIRIKNIHSHRCYRSDGTYVNLTKLSYKTFVLEVSDYEQETDGTPSRYALWGKTNQLRLDCVPSEDLTLKLFIESYPIELTAANLESSIPIDVQWAFAMQSYATAILYLKLQQVEMYNSWFQQYALNKASVSRTDYKKQVHDKSNTQGLISGQPELDPMVRNWN